MEQSKQIYQKALDTLERKHQINHLYCSDVCCTPNALPLPNGSCPIEGTPQCQQTKNLQHKSEEYQQLQYLIDTHFETTTLGMPTSIFISLLTTQSEVWVCGASDIYSYKIDGFANNCFYSIDYCCGCRMDDIIFKPEYYGIAWFYTEQDAKQNLINKGRASKHPTERRNINAEIKNQ